MDALAQLLAKGAHVNAVENIVLGKAVNITATTFDLERYEAPTIYDCRLNAIVDTNLASYVTITPKNNSYVLVAIIENKTTEAVLFSCSEIDKLEAKINNTTITATAAQVEVKQGNTALIANANGVGIAKASISLLDCLTDLIDEINKIVVVVGTTPNVAAITAIKTKIQNLLV